MARDITYAKLKQRLERGEELPQYFKDHAAYYAGPAKTPSGYASGSFEPTTAGRTDAYVDLFQSHGGSMVMLAKGNRSQGVQETCKKHGGFYLGSIGGPAARLTEHRIKQVEGVEYEELGMEAIWRIEVEDFPAFIVTNNKGNDFFADLAAPPPRPKASDLLKPRQRASASRLQSFRAAADFRRQCATQAQPTATGRRSRLSCSVSGS